MKLFEIGDPYGYIGGKPAKGYFYFIDDDCDALKFFSCRDEIQTYWNENLSNVKYIGFTQPEINLNLLKICEFWEFIASKLGEEARIEIMNCSNYNNLIVIQVPQFWSENETVRSLFTLLLRTSVVYYRTTFEKAIKDYDLANSVRHAIYWFLDGHTKPTGSFSIRHPNGYDGFVWKYYDLAKEELGEKLVKP
jgi:hypothetical protein